MYLWSTFISFTLIIPEGREREEGSISGLGGFGGGGGGGGGCLGS